MKQTTQLVGFELMYSQVKTLKEKQFNSNCFTVGSVISWWAQYDDSRTQIHSPQPGHERMS